jgi:acyl dehydratase
MPAHEHIGFTTATTAVPADAWRVSLFCKAIGESDPVYTDEAAARAAGHRACPLPPTYLKAIEGEHFNGAALLRQLQLPMLGVLHAEQSFEFLAPLHVGDTIEVSRTVADVHDKKGGALTCIVVDSDYRVAGSLAARSRQTILVRNTLAVA